MGGGKDDGGHITTEIFTVNVNWNSDDEKWNVNANPQNDNRWNAGNRVFSSNSRVSPALLRGGSF